MILSPDDGKDEIVELESLLQLEDLEQLRLLGFVSRTDSTFSIEF